MRHAKRRLTIAGMVATAGLIGAVAFSGESAAGELDSTASFHGEESAELVLPGTEDQQYPRMEGAKAAKKLGPAARQMLRGLEDESEGVRLAAVSALGRMGSDAEAAVPALEKLLRDPSRRVRLRTGRALAEIRRK
ncbi:MAG: HEAT repeat domain-containing protein [Dehalococcoidia bacterium]